VQLVLHDLSTADVGHHDLQQQATAEHSMMGTAEQQ
jgi:hypothetical protein